MARALVARGCAVRALVREGSDTTGLTSLGVELARGDLIDPASVPPAFDGVDAVVTAAAGYVQRRKEDSLAGSTLTWPCRAKQVDAPRATTMGLILTGGGAIRGSGSRSARGVAGGIRVGAVPNGRRNVHQHVPPQLRLGRGA